MEAQVPASRISASVQSTPNWQDGLALAIGGFALFFSSLTLRGFSFPDQNLFTYQVQQMLAAQDLSSLTFDHTTFQALPPLYLWLQALAIKLFGFNLLAIRFWSAVAAIGGLITNYIAATNMFGRRAGILTAIILACSCFYFALAQTAAPYMMGNFLLNIALLCFLKATHSAELRHIRVYNYCFWLYMGLCVLTLGLPGLFIPLIICGLWLVLIQQYILLRLLVSPVGIGLFLLIVAPWYFLIAYQEPQFISHYFITAPLAHLKHLLTDLPHVVWFTIPAVFIGLLPWSIFLVQGVWLATPPRWQTRQAHEIGLFLLCWSSVVIAYVLFTTLANLGWLLLAMPALAIMVAHYLDAIWERSPMPFVRMSYEILFLTVLVLIAGLLSLLYYRWFPLDNTATPYVQFMLGILLMCSLIATPILRYWSLRWGICTLALMTVICLLALSYCYPLLMGKTQALQTSASISTGQWQAMQNTIAAQQAASRP